MSLDMKFLKFKDVTFGYKKEKVIFKNLSFEITQPVGKGFVIGMMGSSGSGKSTLLKLILDIHKTFTGEIEIFPKNAVISYLPQEPVLFEHLTPKENADYFNRISNYKTKFNKKTFDEIAKVLQIEEVLKSARSINEISGGQKQKIALLRALSIRPDILLLDEPLTGLDEEVKDQFLQTLAQLIQEFNLLVIYVSHHRKEVEYISDVVAYLVKNKDSEVVHSVNLSFANEFFVAPPTISALNATKEIRVNTMQIRLYSDGDIQPIESIRLLQENDILMMSFHENIINFNSEGGFEYRVVAKTGLYTIMQLIKYKVIITVDNELFTKKENQENKYITLTGDINLYDSAGQYLKRAVIKNNKIINDKND